MADGERELLLDVRRLSKRFPGVLANDAVSLQLQRGEILALLGENGAGKSTLVKMLFGLQRPDSGEIFIKGEAVKLRSPRDAIERGVGMVHQHFQLVPVMTVAENVVLGHEPRRAGPAKVPRLGRFIDTRRAAAEVRKLSQRFGLQVPPDAVVEDLPVGTQQRVEIIKALYRGAEILILDEPTAVLTPGETDELLQIMRDLAERGTGIIFITHKLHEVMAVADRVEVLRGGKVVGSARPAETDEAGLASMMVGRSVVLRVEKAPARPTDVVLSIEALEVADDRRQRAVHDLELSVRAGEIVGVAGVQGNGQRELVEAICGMRRPRAGRITIAGRDTTHWNARDVNALGVAHIPEDREKHGLVGSFSIADELVLNRYDEAPFARHGQRDFVAVARHAEALVRRFDVRTPSVQRPSSTLSGGNKQKVIVARELGHRARLVVAAQPTRGVDVGSVEFIHNQLVAARDGGAAVLLVSAELDEVLGLSDRVAVMSDGRIVAVLDAADATRDRVGLLMAGGRDSG